MSETLPSRDPEMLRISESAEFLKERWGPNTPKIAIVFGSGWGSIIDQLNPIHSISYDRVPCLSKTTISGHSGNLHLCSVSGMEFLVFQGRRHFYEGEGWSVIRAPVFLAYELGIRSLLITNAAGGISSKLKVADLMLISDHINMMPSNPLIGTTTHPQIPRFPDQTNVYDCKLGQLLKNAGKESGIDVQEGIYLGLSGPAFETPAEINAFAKLGADAVGMSTIPEAMVANALGMKTIGLSCISNLASGISKKPLSHEDVELASSEALPKMKSLVFAFLTSFATSNTIT